METQRTPSLPAHAQDSRCRCGNLLARLQPNGVELKCRRCKRIVLIPWGTASTWHDVAIEWQDAKQEGGG